MTQCLGNTEHPFVGAVLLLHPPRPALGRGFFPFVPSVFFTEDRQTPPSMFPACMGAHGLHHRLTCVHLLPQGSIPGWTHHRPPCCGWGFFVSVAQQSTHAHLGGHLAFVKMILAQNQKLLQLLIISSPLSVPRPPEPASRAIPITRYY